MPHEYDYKYTVTAGSTTSSNTEWEPYTMYYDYKKAGVITKVTGERKVNTKGKFEKLWEAT